MAQYVYTMNRVGKIVPPNREILSNISLSFFPGAKIGVLGLNGAGKSTLLKIMAGLDTDIEGEARPQPGIRIGYLPQEPELDESKTVREAVEEGVAEVRELLNRFDEISMKFAEPMGDDEMTALLADQAELQEAIENANGWELERTLEQAADALRLASSRLVASSCWTLTWNPPAVTLLTRATIADGSEVELICVSTTGVPLKPDKPIDWKLPPTVQMNHMPGSRQSKRPLPFHHSGWMKN